jgi:protein involved in polysaccharide export with SLBB domain
VFLNGRWVKVRQATEADAASSTIRPDELITQRVIRIPVKDLLAGKQSINIVVRPGDVIRFPAPASGFVTVSGQVARPGPYQVTPNATLLRTIANAGGLTETGIPWRVELTRMVGPARQATVRVDLDAIARHTSPDIFIKDNDLINVGTTGWALPLAVLRNGFRVSYGFGFLLDRNLSNDVFGPPPTNVQGQ